MEAEITKNRRTDKLEEGNRREFFRITFLGDWNKYKIWWKQEEACKFYSRTAKIEWQNSNKKVNDRENKTGTERKRERDQPGDAKAVLKY